MTLIVTPGAPDANSFASDAEATTYNAAALNASAWAAASGPDQEAALITAARILGAMPGAWTGQATLPTQALTWPRTGMQNRNGFDLDPMAIPQELKDAQSEFARQLLEADRLSDNDIVNRRITSLDAGVKITFDVLDVADAGRGVDPLARSTELAGRLMVPDVVKVMLVPSWLKPTAEQILAGNQALPLFESFGPRARGGRF